MVQGNVVEAKPIACGNAETVYAQPLHAQAYPSPYQPAYGPAYQPYGQQTYGQQPYGAQPYGQAAPSGGNGMAMAGAGLAGLAGGFLAAELIDDIF